MPDYVLQCLAAVNVAGRHDWHHRLECVRDPRPTEYAPPTDLDDFGLERLTAAQQLGPEEHDPPDFEETALWLIGHARDGDLYRCKQCGAWFLAQRHRRQETCGSDVCLRAQNRDHQRAYRRRE